MSRASLDKDPRAVASMFDGVARRYDITNTVLSAGRDRYWRRATRAALRAGPGDTVLDLAAGTAVSTVEIAKSGAWCLAADFSVGMLHAGHQRPVPKVGADATRLPFGDDVFDEDPTMHALQERVADLLGTEAAGFAKVLGVRMAIPHHFEMFEFNTAPPDAFAAACRQARVACKVLRCGERWTATTAS